MRGSDGDLGGQSLELQTSGLWTLCLEGWECCIDKDNKMLQRNMGGPGEGLRAPSGNALLVAPAKQSPKESRSCLSLGA